MLSNTNNERNKFATRIKVFLSSITFGIISIPQKVLADDIFTSDASDSAIENFTKLYDQWWWVACIVFLAFWGFSTNEKTKPKWGWAAISTFAVYIIVHNYDIIVGTLNTIVEWF